MSVDRANHPLVQTLLACATNPLAIVDANGRVVGANAAFVSCTGLAGENILPALSDEGSIALRAALLDGAAARGAPAASWRGGPGWSATTRSVEVDGETFAILSAARTSHEHVPWQCIANATSESEALADAIDNLPIGVVLLEVDRQNRPRLIAHNSAYARLRGVGANELLTAPAPRVFDAEGRLLTDVELPGVATALTGEPLREVIFRIEGDDGLMRTILCSATPVTTRDAVRRAVCVLLDITDRAKAEEARRASDQRCAGFFDALHDASAVFEAVPGEGGGHDWVYREANDSLLRQLGRERNDLVGRRIDDLFPAVALRLKPLLDSVLAAEARNLERESTYGEADFLVRAFSIGATEVVVTALDITERKSTERALRSSKERFETTATTLPGALYDYIGTPDEHGNFVYLSPGASEIFEMPIEDLLGPSEPFWRCVVIEDIGALRDAHTRRGGEREEVECKIVTPNGTKKVLRFSWRASTIGDDGTIRGSGFILDVTAAAATRQALDRSRRELTSLVERLPTGVFLERAGAIVYANPELARCCGHYCATDLIGMATTQIFAESQAVSARFSREQEWTYRRPDGREVVLVTSPRRDVEFDGRTASLVTVTDHTELRAMRSRLMQADRLASVGLLAAGVAHEVNNPLSFVVASMEAMSDALSGSPIDGELLRQGLADARVGAHRVRQVVRDLKTFSHARLDPDRSAPIDVNALLDASSNMVQNEIRHRARLVKSYGRPPLVLGNEARLGQVFVNLLVNATQALPEDEVDTHAIRMETYVSPDGEAVIEVSDTGTGIGQAALDRIFEPFFTTKPDGVGTGLGLAICRTSVEAMGGTIQVANLPIRGACFRVTLPAYVAEPKVSPKPRGIVRDGRARRGRVLVIDDEPVIARSLGRMLGKEHDVTTCTDGRELIVRCRNGERFDVILCDLMMPEVTGMDLHATLSTLDAAQASKMVFLTGGAFTAKAAAFLEGTAHPWIEKPYDSENVRAIVRTLVETGTLRA